MRIEVVNNNYFPNEQKMILIVDQLNRTLTFESKEKKVIDLHDYLIRKSKTKK